MIRSVIIDDEFLARERLRKLLTNHEDIRIVGEARNGKEGLSLIRSTNPELVFLDIEMPDINGFTVVDSLTYKPIMVFTTAYANYAIQAFEVQAMDYLLKPFDEERLGDCLSRVREKIRTGKFASLALQMEKFVKSHTAETSRYRSSFNIKDKGEITEVYVDEVIMMEADGNYIRLVTPQKTYLLRLSMNNLEHDLNPDHFIRIHRSFILNKHAIKAQKYLGNNEYEFIMNNDKRVTSSRSFKSIIQKSFSS